MYCPRCGQQAFDEVRFCSRCGFRLDGVSTLLDHDGSIQVTAPDVQSSAISPRQKGMRLGVKLIFLSIVLFPPSLGLSILFDNPGPMLLPLTAFLIGLTRFLYSVIFEEETAPARQMPQHIPGRAFKQNMALPPPPVSINPARPANTADGLNAPSVTENTTNLLDNKIRNGER